VTLPASYVMDVFRVAGGKRHTYCFHGGVDDGFTANVKNKAFLKEDGESEDAKYLQRFRYERFYREEVSDLHLQNQQAFVPERDRQWAAEVDGDTLVADWTLCPLAEKKMLGGKGAATRLPNILACTCWARRTRACSMPSLSIRRMRRPAIRRAGALPGGAFSLNGGSRRKRRAFSSRSSSPHHRLSIRLDRCDDGYVEKFAALNVREPGKWSREPQKGVGLLIVGIRTMG
jgi:hypothetical protein